MGELGENGMFSYKLSHVSKPPSGISPEICHWSEGLEKEMRLLNLQIGTSY